MSQIIPSPVGCCTPCSPSSSGGPPGPIGPEGPAGADGADGVSPFTSSTLGTEQMPAEGDTVEVTVDSDTSWVAVGEPLYVEFWGTLIVTAVTSTTITLENPEDTASGTYADNAAPGTVLPVASKITPTGWQGPAGSASTSGLLQSANNLSDVANAATSRSNLGLGTMAVQNANAVAITGGTITGGAITGITDLAVADGGTGASTASGARTNLGLNPSAADKIFYSTALNTWAESGITTFGRNLIAAADYLAGLQVLRTWARNQGQIAVPALIDFNVAGDNAFTILQTSPAFILDKVIIYNASTSLTTATAGLFTAAGGGGMTLAAIQSLATLNAPGKFMELVLEAVCGTDFRSEGTLYFRIGTPQGAAATAGVVLIGTALSA